MWVINFNGKNFGAKIFENITITFLSSLAVVIYIVAFMLPKNTFMYSASVLLGIGSAVLWTAIGDFIHMLHMICNHRRWWNTLVYNTICGYCFNRVWSLEISTYTLNGMDRITFKGKMLPSYLSGYQFYERGFNENRLKLYHISYVI